MANKLPPESRSQILHLLCEGNSIRAVTRLTGVSKNTVTKLLTDAGKACMAYHDANVRDVTARRVQVDEIWTFTYAKQKNVAPILKKHVSDFPLIALPASSYNSAFGGDPAPSVPKMLKVQYRMDGKEGKAEFKENAAIMLPNQK